MTDREYVNAVQDELILEGFNNLKCTSRNRFYAEKDDKWYEFRVKYCRTPRRLKMTDVGYMTGLMNPNTIGVLITNGFELTEFVQNYLKDNGVDATILNWEPGTNISNELSMEKMYEIKVTSWYVGDEESEDITLYYRKTLEESERLKDELYEMDADVDSGCEEANWKIKDISISESPVDIHCIKLRVLYDDYITVFTCSTLEECKKHMDELLNEDTKEESFYNKIWEITIRPEPLAPSERYALLNSDVLYKRRNNI